MPSRKTIEQLKRQLQQKNIYLTLCDSQQYINTDHKLKFICSHNHTFEATPHNILQGHGCKICAIQYTTTKNINPNSPAVLQCLKNNNLKLLETYKGIMHNHQYQCLNCGNEFLGLAIKQYMHQYRKYDNYFACLNCRQQNKSENAKQKLLINNCVPLQDITNLSIPIKIKRSCGHIEIIAPKKIIAQSVKCNICDQERISTIKKQILQYAGNNNQKCVDISNIQNVNSPIDIQCPQNHIWTTTVRRLLNRHGCPQCYGNALKTDQQFRQQLKIKNSIVFLVPGQQYINATTKLQFTCSQHHVWYQTPANVLNNTTHCPICSANRKYSKLAIRWLNYISNHENINIQHAENGGEFQIPGNNIWCDGYCVETNTVYEFYGDYWHGNPTIFNKDDINPSLKKRYGMLLANTRRRETIIKKLGYNLISIWEHEFNEKYLTI